MNQENRPCDSTSDHPQVPRHTEEQPRNRFAHPPVGARRGRAILRRRLHRRIQPGVQRPDHDPFLHDQLPALQQGHLLVQHHRPLDGARDQQRRHHSPATNTRLALPRLRRDLRHRHPQRPAHRQAPRPRHHPRHLHPHPHEQVARVRRPGDRQGDILHVYQVIGCMKKF